MGAIIKSLAADKPKVHADVFRGACHKYQLLRPDA